MPDQEQELYSRYDGRLSRLEANVEGLSNLLTQQGNEIHQISLAIQRGNTTQWPTVFGGITLVVLLVTGYVALPLNSLGDQFQEYKRTNEQRHARFEEQTNTRFADIDSVLQREMRLLDDTIQREMRILDAQQAVRIDLLYDEAQSQKRDIRDILETSSKDNARIIAIERELFGKPRNGL